MEVLSQSVIQHILDEFSFVADIERSFIHYSKNEAVIPPVGELLMEKGETHIKYGYVKHQPYFVIKVASGFYDNPKLGLSSSQGLVLLFSQQTGEPVAFLQDGGILTNYRTACAGAIAAKYLAPARIDNIGIMGSGIQAQLQASMIAAETGCKNIRLWGRNAESALKCVNLLRASGLNATYCESVNELAEHSQIIVTTTPSEEPILKASHLSGTTLIIAVGADTAEKQELETGILRHARLVTDSRSQAAQRGELSHLIKTLPEASERTAALSQIAELGEIIANAQSKGHPLDHTHNGQFEGTTVVDLTGVATQDLAIAQAVLEKWQATTGPGY